MQAIQVPRRNAQTGHALILTMVYTGISLLLLASIIGRTSSNVVVTERNNGFNRAVAAAEAGTETVLARMINDFVNQSIDYNNLAPYRSIVPSTFLPVGWPAEYIFTDNAGAFNRASVTSTGPSVATNLDGSFTGLYGIVFPFRVTSNARHSVSLYSKGNANDIAAAVQQDIQLACIPVFQFMSFYAMDLEINPSPLMTMWGKVHCNASIYAAPVTGLDFRGAVSAVGKIYNDRMLDDPSYGSAKVAPTYNGTKKEFPNVSSLTLPIGTNSSPGAIAAILDLPPLGELAASPMGMQRYYNKADLIITTTTNGVFLQSGLWNGFTSLAPDMTNGMFSFITSTSTFFDPREAKTNLVTDINVGALNKWMTNTGPGGGSALNNLKKFQTTFALNSIYVNDKRFNAAKLTVVRVSNGQLLPPDGLTVATDRPIYVKGNYNAPDLTVGQTNTANTRPASLVGDSITVLSENWLDANSTSASRPAINTTVNAAFLAGIVQTTNVSGVKHYSGGLENFPRFLEDWGGGKTLTYNGSMVVLFPSRYARGYWGNAGVYVPPVRSWAFDTKFLTQSGLPPCTPQVRKLIRGQWNVVAVSP